jgi:hypothetical protein
MARLLGQKKTRRSTQTDEEGASRTLSIVQSIILEVCESRISSLAEHIYFGSVDVDSTTSQQQRSNILLYLVLATQAIRK